MQDYIKQYLNFIAKYTKLNYFVKNSIIKNITIKEYKKGEYILSQGNNCKNMLFIAKGKARGYLIDEDGNEKTWIFYFNTGQSHMVNLHPIDYYAFMHKSKSNITIQALSDCKILIIGNYDYINTNITKYMCLFAKKISDEAYFYTHNYILQNIKDAKTRTKEFISNNPHLLTMFPQKHIASMLGITPEYFSKIKQEINKSLNLD